MFNMPPVDFRLNGLDHELDPDDFDMNWNHVTLDAPGSPSLVSASSPSSSASTSSGPGSVADPDDSPSPGVPVTNSTPLSCRFPGCPRILFREHTRKKHEESHKPKAPVPCSEPGCGTTFSRAHDRLRHEVREHNHPCHRCSVCDSFFTNKTTLGRHKCKPAKR
ncbi:hypothetical protein C8R44DRAFT_336571 [Mycena epipterygia]|nr:hypothetical protein C8R44DRAFT_336571 [Mycena epipterygia]